jgi:rhodanese-related sulfurtransferase
MLLLFLGAGLLGFQIAEGRTVGYKNISVQKFSEMMQHKDFILINVHIPYQGEIPGTDRLIPYHSIDRRQEELPADRNAKIVVYCLTGPMGYAAADKLVKLGYTNVLHFEGGMAAWVRSGRQLMNRKGEP